MNDPVHPFAKTLGQGPYRFVGMFSINPKAPQFGQPVVNPNDVHPNFVRGAGTCAHCNMAILNVYQVQTASGEVFGVGSDCILKAGMPAKELTLVEKAVKAHEKAKRLARKVSKGNAARNELSSLLSVHNALFKSQKHPSMPHRSDLTLFDYVLYCMTRSNDGGVVIVLKRVQDILNKLNQ